MTPGATVERVHVRACVGCGKVSSVVVRLPSGERLCASCARFAVRVLDTRQPEIDVFLASPEAP